VNIDEATEYYPLVSNTIWRYLISDVITCASSLSVRKK